MRKIGSVSDRAQADVFGSYLYANDIQSDIEPASDGEWSVWIHADEKIDEASASLSDFKDNPSNPKYLQGAESGKQKLQIEAARDARWKKQYHDRTKTIKSSRIGLVTAVLIGFCVILAVISNFGEDNSIVSQLTVTSFTVSEGLVFFSKNLPEIRAGHVWRIVTPVFVHFGFLHLLLNMLWLHTLGSAFERKHGPVRFLLFIVVVAIPSNLLQFLFQGPSFGGMSGVLFALLAYFWIRPRVDSSYDVHLNQSTFVMMGLWLLLGFVMPGLHIANIVHGTGVLVGLAVGYLAGWLSMRTSLGR